MKKLNRELVILRTFTVCIVGCMVFMSMHGFKIKEDRSFGTIDVERINIVEKDGTVKMLITNEAHFPTKGDSINNTVYHERKKRAGMLFFNEDGKECGGLIYDGKKNENGHSSGLSLTYDQYDGDQVMQLLTTDTKREGRRFVSSMLAFNDRAENETQELTNQINLELEAIKDPMERRKKYMAYKEQGLVGSTPRIMLGKTTSQNNGLFLFDDNGMPRAQFSINKDNEVQLVVYNEKGEITSSWPK
ncbi:hypothetical protein DFQ11_10843 [Winogradskyella epiphytica]|uniref:Uncharacterized protein n=1 Tax=Winogradskyella epiphytica TaxID=262005 RepID=A0A2V4XFZ9_9FLAO|nr:hypothetical protein [Winogradskyella epiphytica]PYE80019.1 hypothetical protein DFQ11_10843 [Winogradskyella epiphytica]GGW73194.1 hypothetical protein GCM10008085_26810 [Winogradskyella epiphytica]